MKKLLALLLLLAVTNIFSQDKNLDIKIKYKLTRSESFVVTDKPGHILASAEGIGTAEINSETVQLKSTFNTDYTSGSGDFLVYYTLTSEDNSMLTLKGTGRTTYNVAEYKFEGKVVVDNGTGKFSSFKGSGSLKGIRKSIIEKGSEAEISILIQLD